MVGAALAWGGAGFTAGMGAAARAAQAVANGTQAMSKLARVGQFLDKAGKVARRWLASASWVAW